MSDLIEDSSTKNRRIAKNTLLLYIRTFFVMLVSLYTSRVILNVLGVEDYGLYNVVGGSIAMFSLFSGSLSGAISRFITFGIGKGDKARLKVTFSTCMNIQFALSAILFILMEAVGLWFLTQKLNIPPDRMYAAHWVLQFSILSFVMGLISVPYDACIVAHERMNVVAYMGILDVILKLTFVYLLYIIPFDKLIIYAALLFIISVIMRIIYGVYCSKKFEECKYEKVFDRQLFREMASFAGWGFFGNATWLFNTQGVNILINIFFGVTLNAARGIVTQVEGAIMKFVNNFMVAISPQITKSYAQEDMEFLHLLICRGSKFSYLLLCIFAIPIGVESSYILHLWLETVPEDTSLFLRISLCSTAMVLLGNTGFQAIMATGNIRNYQLTMTIVSCLVFPLTWIAYKLGAPACTPYIIFTIVYAVLDIIRLSFMKRMIGFRISMFYVKVIFPIILTTTVALGLSILVLNHYEESFIRLIIITAVSTLSIAITTYLWGLDRNEKKIANRYLIKILHCGK